MWCPTLVGVVPVLLVLVVKALREVSPVVDPGSGDRLVVIRLVIPPLAYQMLDSLLEAAKLVGSEVKITGIDDGGTVTLTAIGSEWTFARRATCFSRTFPYRSGPTACSTTASVLCARIARSVEAPPPPRDSRSAHSSLMVE
jgi:hypothetical protein